MIFFLVLGILLGGLSVVFILENSMPITVTLFSWQFSGSLSMVLFTAVISGAVIALLMLLPSFIKDDMYVSVLKKQKKELESELAEKNRIIAEIPTTVAVDAASA